MDDITYVGLDVHKATVCVAVTESGRGGKVRQNTCAGFHLEEDREGRRPTYCRC
jgi:hypothetical protein